MAKLDSCKKKAFFDDFLILAKRSFLIYIKHMILYPFLTHRNQFFKSQLIALTGFSRFCNRFPLKVCMYVSFICLLFSSYSNQLKKKTSKGSYAVIM
jgi:hypothetical protein